MQSLNPDEVVDKDDKPNISVIDQKLLKKKIISFGKIVNDAKQEEETGECDGNEWNPSTSRILYDKPYRPIINSGEKKTEIFSYTSSEDEDGYDVTITTLPEPTIPDEVGSIESGKFFRNQIREQMLVEINNLLKINKKDILFNITDGILTIQNRENHNDKTGIMKPSCPTFEEITLLKANYKETEFPILIEKKIAGQYKVTKKELIAAIIEYNGGVQMSQKAIDAKITDLVEDREKLIDLLNVSKRYRNIKKNIK